MSGPSPGGQPPSPEWKDYRDWKAWQRDRVEEKMRPVRLFGIAMFVTGGAAGWLIASVWFYYHPW